jgi:DNA polymerase-3 subunit beta
VLVAAKGLAEVQRLAGDGEIEVVLRERDVVFRTSRAEVTARLIEGDFPNYEQLIPSGYPNRLTVGREPLLDALDRVQIVGQNRDNAAVRLAMSAEGLELSMSAQDVGNAQETLDAKFEGGELTAAFNPVFLRDGAEAIDAEEVQLETIDPLKPATLRAADGGEFLYLLMPVRTS